MFLYKDHFECDYWRTSKCVDKRDIPLCSKCNLKGLCDICRNRYFKHLCSVCKYNNE